MHKGRALQRCTLFCLLLRYSTNAASSLHQWLFSWRSALLLASCSLTQTYTSSAYSGWWYKAQFIDKCVTRDWVAYCRELSTLLFRSMDSLSHESIFSLSTLCSCPPVTVQLCFRCVKSNAFILLMTCWNYCHFFGLSMGLLSVIDSSNIPLI